MSDFRKIFGLLRGNILVLVSSLVIWEFVLQIVTPYEALYIFALGGSGVTLGILSTTRMLFSTFLRIPGGYLADKHGRRKVFSLAAIVSSLGYLFYIFAKSWLWLLPGAFLLSISGLAEPAMGAIKADSVKPEERGRGYAIINTIPRIPAMVAPAIGGFLIADRSSDFGISLIGIRIGYVALFFGVILSGLICLFYLRDIYQPEDKGSLKLGLNMFGDVLEIISQSPLSIKRLLLLGGFFMFCFHLDSSLVAVYAIDVGGLSTIEWGLIVSLTMVISSLATLLIGWLVDRYGRKRVFVPAIVALGISTLLFLVSDSFTKFLFARIIGSIGLYGRMISFQVLVADSIPVSIRGRIMGVYNICMHAGSSIAVLLSGFLYDVSPEYPFYTSAFAYAIAALVAVKFLNEPETQQL
jgi:MFS family permease